ncbi:hypothetical protein V2H77_17965 [Photorhabdus sp. P32]
MPVLRARAAQSPQAAPLRRSEQLAAKRKIPTFGVQFIYHRAAGAGQC